MLELSKIESEIIASQNCVAKQDFVAIATELNEEGKASHVGLLIHCKDIHYIFHFLPDKIRFSPVPSDKIWVHKILELINTDFVSPFLAHCLFIEQNAKPNFGQFFGDTYYDKNGRFFSNGGVKEYMTCVGFCINVVRGFLEGNEYFSVTDWTDSQTLASPDHYFDNFVKQQVDNGFMMAEDALLFRQHLRRIRPSEYLTSAFVNDLPIRKSAIDDMIGQTEKILVNKSQQRNRLGENRQFSPN